MLLDVKQGDKLYHKRLGDITIVRVQANSIKADTGRDGELVFPFYDFGKVLFVEKSHEKNYFNNEDEYAEFCIQDKKAKEEKIIADALEHKRRQDIIIKYQRESIEKARQQKDKTDSKNNIAVENKKNDLKQSPTKYNHVQRVVGNPAQEIRNVIDELINYTKEYINKLDDLKIINEKFKNHTTGHFEYPDPLEQQLYLLRYFYAYYYEYKKIMDCIGQHFQEINIVSIGCGSCIDGLALKHAVKRPTSYLGIDIVEWAYKLPLPSNYEIHNISINADTIDHLKDATVLFFPKSLSDISNSEMNDIKKWIKKSAIEKDEICVAVSFVYNSEYHDKMSPASQFNRYEDIVSLLVEKNYVVDVPHSFMFKEKEDSNKKIWHVDKEMQQPSNLQDFFRGGLENICNMYKKNNVHCNICEKTNGQYDNECKYIQPKLSAAGINYTCSILRKG